MIKKSIILYYLFFIAQCLAQQNPFSIVSATSNEIIIDFLTPSYNQSLLQVDGVDYVVYHSRTSGWTADVGKPQLPEEGTLIGIPHNVSIKVEIIASKFEIESTQPVLPAPSYNFDDNNEAVASYNPDKQFYELANELYPAQVAEVDEIAQLRDQRVAKLIVHPIQYNPTTKSIKRFSHLRLKCTFSALSKVSFTNWNPSGEDKQFETVYKDLILNYKEAKSWRGKFGESLSSITSDSTAWFVPGRTYYRIPIAQDGMYRLSYSQLLAAGFDLQSVNVSSIALYNKGNSEPIDINTSSVNPSEWYVDFYAKRNYGVNSFYDLYSDTNYYWLTANDAHPKRFQIDSSLAGIPIATPQSYRAMQHFEQDLKYYFGYNDDEIANTDDVPGEGWYWIDFFPNTIWNYTFKLDTIVHVTGSNVTLQARLNGETKTSPTSQHTAEVRLNNVLVGQASWLDNTEVIIDLSFPDTMLKSGNNVLQIKSITTPSPVNKFYLDWFQIGYNRPFVAINNQLEFVVPSQTGIGPAKFIISKFTTDTVDIFDLSTARKIVGASIESTKVIFQDTSSMSKRYLVISRNARQNVSHLESRVFSNLRYNSTGSDYIVITHKNFYDAANRLAQARASRGNLRTTVVDVQDIYDEFSFGLLKPDAIKAFLKHTYYFWRQPAPTYVVMFGDACWDFKGHLATTVKKNYVPASGNPPSDNALVSFDAVQNYLPYMLIGRIPVEDPVQADRVVTKILNYDNAPIDDWNKKSLFISGGTDQFERTTFNGYSDNLINNEILPPPIAGQVNRVYKSSSVIVDGDSKGYMQNLLKNGLSYISFIGHSGGRLWNVDIGNPNDLQNTNGKLPFVSSVSCNVGFFSAPNFNVLAEDFLMADNRGAIGTWAGSSVGYASVGWWLTQKFLSAAAFDYGRSLGLLTTLARINFWAINGITTPIVVQTLQLHPLLGDPYTVWAVPLKPDIDVNTSDIHLSSQAPTSDSITAVKVTYRNFGLVPDDSIRVTLKDAYTTVSGKYMGETDIVPPFRVVPFGKVDSFSVPWNVRGKPGSHVVKVTFDPDGKIPEIQKSNNSAELSVYIYRNVIAPLKPPANAVTKSGSRRLVVSVPTTNDTTRLTYFFEVDTVPDFSSPYWISSGQILPGPVSVEWLTPPLENNRLYFWHARSWDGSKYGAWTLSSFVTSDSLASVDSIVWRQSSKKQFSQNVISNLSVSDSGVSLRMSNGLPIFVRSVGGRVYPDSDYYSIIKIGDVTVFGLYFFGANSFITARIDPLTGEYIAKGYSLSVPGQKDSMISFLQTTPYGYYVAISSVLDAKTNVDSTLKSEIKALGSAKIDSVSVNQSWCLFSRKGNGTPLMTPLEGYSRNGIATVQFQMPNYFSTGSGQILSSPIGPAHQWLSLSWQPYVPSSTASERLLVLGIKTDGSVDTLMNIPDNTMVVDLSTINPTTYPRLSLLAKLSNSDGLYTPLLKRWKVLYLPPQDLATSAWAFHVQSTSLQVGDTLKVSMDVYNIGFRNSDSGKVAFTALPSNTVLHEEAFGQLQVDGSQHLDVKMIPPSSPTEQTLRVELIPKTGTNDAFAENNILTVPFKIVGMAQVPSESYEVLIDGRHIVNNDYVSASPFVTIKFPAKKESQINLVSGVKIILDNLEIYPTNTLPPQTGALQRKPETGMILLNPSLNDGVHTLTLSKAIPNQKDSMITSLQFNVLSQPKLLNVYNYPNPFQSETYFTFVLTGIGSSEGVVVKVYTVAGRLIRQIYVPISSLQVGLNTILWDGRDQDGEEIGNGYYFSKVILKTSSGSEETIQKVMKVR